MCKLIEIDLGEKWKDDIFKYSKRINKFSYRSGTEYINTTFDYPDKNTVIRNRINENSHNKSREIAKYDNNRKLLSAAFYEFNNNEWLKTEEDFYSYDFEDSTKIFERKQFQNKGNRIIEEFVEQTFKSDKSLKEIITFKEANHQSIAEYKFDDYDRELEFLMYDIYGNKQENVLKSTTKYFDNSEINSLFSTRIDGSNEWLLISRSFTKYLLNKEIIVTVNFTNNSKKKEIKYFNELKQITRIDFFNFIDNIWEKVSIIENEYLNNFLSKETSFSPEKEKLCKNSKIEFDNIDGLITHKTIYSYINNRWVEFSKSIFEFM
jgi:hypothetical protein